MSMFQGSLTALITPFRTDGSIDKRAFSEFVEWQIEQGTHGLVPVGTTGESPTLSHEEHKEVIAMTVDIANGRVPVLAGTGSNATNEAIELTAYAKEIGATGALVVTPYYNKPSQEGLFQHFKAIQDAVAFPLVIYNIPGRSVIDMSVETMARLAIMPNIVGVKDATGQVERVTQQRLACGEDFIQLSGEDATALAFNAHGGVGCISVASNIAPFECAQFQNAMMAGDYVAARAWQDKLMPLQEVLFIESSPGPVKYAAARRGICHDHLRLPLVSPSRETREKVGDVLHTLGLSRAY